LNSRERFLKALLFDNPDKIPFSPGGPRESTLAVWRKQGLPEGVNYMSHIMGLLGIEPEKTKPQVGIGVSFQMIPTFEEKVLEHKDGHYIVKDWMGAITEISDEFDYTYIRSARDFVTRKWHKFPVENRDDWEEMKWRYSAETEGRYPQDFEQRCEALNERDYPATFSFNGPFWQLREWVGMENLCIMMLDDPDFVLEMVEFWTNFVSRTMKPMLEKVDFDCIQISEDMAYKVHSMISPAMVRQFLFPAYERWVPQMKNGGCPVVMVDSDGYVADLIPLWIESDINCTSPMEVAAENDIIEYRKMYGTKMAFRGGIDKRALAKGGSIMEEELMRVIPPLLEQGGFIPGCDHGVPPDISWPNFVDYCRLLAELTGWL